MSFIKKKKEPPRQPEIKYENDFRNELCTQAQLAEELINEHLKGNKINFDKLHLDPKGIRTVYIAAKSPHMPLALWAERVFETVCCSFAKALCIEELSLSPPPADRHTLIIIIGREIPPSLNDCQGKTVLLTGDGTLKGRSLCTRLENPCSLQIADFTLSYLLLTMLAVYIARRKGLLTELYYRLVLEAFAELRAALNNIMKNEQFIIRLADELSPEHLIITGGSDDFPCALYISRLLCTAFGKDIGAVKPEALEHIHDRSNVLALASNDKLYSHLPSLDYSFKIAPLGCDDSIKNICYQGMLPLFNPLLSCVTAQVIAYHIIYKNESES